MKPQILICLRTAVVARDTFAVILLAGYFAHFLSQLRETLLRCLIEGHLF